MDAQCVKDLESYGIATSNTLRNVLTTCQDPVEAIKNFQSANSIQLSSLKPIMKLLDLHGIRRVECFETVNNNLLDKILAKIKSLGENPTPGNVLKLEQQLERSFKLYKAPKIRPIVLETLKQLPKVADRYLRLIVYDKNFYNDCAVSVRQQIWVKNESLFDEDVIPVIDTYLEEKQKLLLTSEKSATNFFNCDTTKTRRQWDQVQQLITMVGEYEILYKRLVTLIRTRFINTNNAHLCSLRLEILMGIHDINVDYAIKIDPCHEFAWCLDACVRDKHLDSQQSSKLKTILDGNRKELSKYFGDMAMISRNPHITHFNCSMVIKILRANISSGFILPRDHVPLQLILKLIALSVHAMDILKGEFCQCLIEADVITRFLPSFTVFIGDDILTLELQKAPEEVSDEFNAENLSDELTDSATEFLTTNEICALLWLHYLIEVLPTKRRLLSRTSLYRYIQVLPDLANKITLQDPWIHLFINQLILANSVDPLISDEFIAEKIISNLLIKSIKLQQNVKFHLLRLCAHLKQSVSDAKFDDARDVLISTYDEISFKTEGNTHLDHFFIKEFDKHKTTITTTNLSRENVNTISLANNLESAGSSL